MPRWRRMVLGSTLAVCVLGLAGRGAAETAGAADERAAELQRRVLGQLDAPLLFVKRHSYVGIHIYDTYYKWPPGGGGIYLVENPAAPRKDWKIRPLIDETTPGTLGHGVYTHPELSWDAKRLLFCFKGEPTGSTRIYEIGIDGRGLRAVSDPRPCCACYKGSHAGQHDIAPAYLPDGRIVFLSTRPSGLVPCANEGVSILHVMNADGSDVHPISVNNVNEFDPAVLPDGRILFGRWEYVDKNALTLQSLWTVHPDGTQETALFANNMVFPEALLDARPVPGTPLIVATLAKHNHTPRGSIALIDPRLGKNNPQAITNLEHPDDPTCDVGDSCEPWPVSAELVLFSGRPAGEKRNVLQWIDRQGHRGTLLADPEICIHAPMLVKPRAVPPVLPSTVDRHATSGNFYVQDIYQGLKGVKRGDVKWLRVIEETSRVSPTPGGKQPYNQTFLVSAALAFSAKNFLGVVPVEPDGSVYFSAPSGRAIYFQALDADHRLVHGMRTFVQAAPGTTRSCIGCHEYKFASPEGSPTRPLGDRQPQPLQPESWGSGYVDYPGMIQPVLDRHCVACHGGKQDLAAGLDLTGGWTEHFNISYENLVNRRETQLVAYWIAGIDCMNGTAFWSAPLFPPRSHGSGAAPLAELLVRGHHGYVPNLSRTERDLLFAWIDTNGLYHGTWDYTHNGCAIKNWAATQQQLAAEMKATGCMQCHGPFENDWINLQQPALSRILRAPLAKGGDGCGLAACRNRKVDPTPRLRLLWSGYAHAVQPVDKFPKQPLRPQNTEGPPVVTFAGTSDAHYQAMLAIIEHARDEALASPRADMPGADVQAGVCRQFNPPPLPETAPPLAATVGDDAVVHLAWERSARTIGLDSEVHRGDRPDFQPSEKTRLTRTGLFTYDDKAAPAGKQYYALLLATDAKSSRPAYAVVDVPAPPAPPAPANVRAVGCASSVRLNWSSVGLGSSYRVERAKAGTPTFQPLTPEPIRMASFVDGTAEPGVEYAYVVRAISYRGVEGAATRPVAATARLVQRPVFAMTAQRAATAVSESGEKISGRLVAPAKLAGGVLDTHGGGFLAFAHRSEFDLAQPLSVMAWVRFDEAGKMPVVIGCGQWKATGWFLQRIGGRWRWHVGGLDCDGGKPAVGQWLHVAAVYDGHATCLYQDGKLIAQSQGAVNPCAWSGELLVGQYAQPAHDDYQFHGRLASLKIYHRAITPTEALEAAQQRPAEAALAAGR